MKRLCMIFPLALILCFIVGCQDKKAIAELEAMKVQTEVEEQNKALILHWYEEFDKGNINKAWEMLAPDFLWYSPSNNPTPRSKEETYEYLTETLKAFKEMSHKIEEIMSVNDKVIVRTIDYATHEGEFRGIPASGIKVEFGAIAIFHIKEGKIIEIWEEADKLGWFHQLGMELRPKD